MTKCDLNLQGQGHSANALKSQHLANCWSYGVDFDLCIHIINHVEQNVTLAFKVKGHFNQCV